MFLRVYSWGFCAALWLVVLVCVLGVVSTSGEDRKPFAFLTVIVGSMALAGTLLLRAVERKRSDDQARGPG